MTLKIGVVGGTGNVGRKILQILEEREVGISSLHIFASERSLGKKVEFKGVELTIEALTEEAMKESFDYLFFSAGGGISEKYGKIAAEAGNIVIDNSSQWRMNVDVPLIVPEINGDLLKNYRGIIANPNCSTIQMVSALYPLHRAYKIQRIVVSTYQAVSGSGTAGIEELEGQLKDGEHKPSTYPVKIAGNCVPHIDVFQNDGYTKEEHKMIFETQKILDDQKIQVQPTAVRVPVFNGHSESVYVEFEKAPDIEETRRILQSQSNIVLMDEPESLIYPTVFDADERDEVFIGRLRKDLFNVKGLSMWIVADNLRKGAATNAVEVMLHMEGLKKQ